MPSIVIRLDPALLPNANADLRYLIPDYLTNRSGGNIQDDGYDYETDGDAMYIYLSVADIQAAIPFVIGLLESDVLGEGVLAVGARVGISALSAIETDSFEIIYPEEYIPGFIPNIGR